jgi:hypothetical protein
MKWTKYKYQIETHQRLLLYLYENEIISYIKKKKKKKKKMNKNELGQDPKHYSVNMVDIHF